MSTQDPRDLAGAGSRWSKRAGYSVHYRLEGAGEPALLLLHGFGASVFSWRKVLGPLSALGTVIAYDRPGFGLTERPARGSWTGPSPYGDDANVETAIALCDAMGVSKLIVVGHSAGGRLAVLIGQRHPERVSGLILAAPALGTRHHPLPGLLRLLAASAAGRRMGPALVRRFITRADKLLALAWHDRSLLSQEDYDGYRLPLSVRGWDQGLWEVVTALGGGAALPEARCALEGLRMPVLFITGDDDRIVPTSETRKIAARLPGATLVVIPECGHLPQEERPDAFVQAVSSFVGR